MCVVPAPLLQERPSGEHTSLVSIQIRAFASFPPLHCACARIHPEAFQPVTSIRQASYGRHETRVSFLERRRRGRTNPSTGKDAHTTVEGAYPLPAAVPTASVSTNRHSTPLNTGLTSTLQVVRVEEQLSHTRHSSLFTRNPSFPAAGNVTRVDTVSARMLACPSIFPWLRRTCALLSRWNHQRLPSHYPRALRCLCAETLVCG